MARLSVSEFDKVILVGGSTRIPLVRRRVEQFFGAAPLDRINPDEVVAIGAAIQAAALTEVARRRSIPPAPVPGTRKSFATEPDDEEVTAAHRLPARIAELEKMRPPTATSPRDPGPSIGQAAPDDRRAAREGPGCTPAFDSSAHRDAASADRDARTLDLDTGPADRDASGLAGGARRLGAAACRGQGPSPDARGAQSGRHHSARRSRIKTSCGRPCRRGRRRRRPPSRHRCSST